VQGLCAVSYAVGSCPRTEAHIAQIAQHFSELGISYARGRLRTVHLATDEDHLAPRII
jgi:hypothetical protein